MGKLHSRREYSQHLVFTLQLFPHLLSGQSVPKKVPGDLGKEEAGRLQTSEEAATGQV